MPKLKTNKAAKKRYSLKAVAVVLAALMLIATAMLTANAATDGAIGEKVIELSKEITEKISVMFNGEEIDVTVKYTPVTDETGDSAIYEIILPENPPENEQGDDEVVFELNEVMEEFGKLVLEKG